LHQVRITDRIVADLEQGVRTWLQPWNAGHMAGRITRSPRWNGKPYSGSNVVSLCGESVVKGYCASIWMTFKQALELGGWYVRAIMDRSLSMLPVRSGAEAQCTEWDNADSV